MESLREPAWCADESAVRSVRGAASERQLALSHIFSLPNSLLITIDPNGYIRGASACWETVIGYRDSELVGRSWQAFVHVDDRQKVLDHWLRLRAGESVADATLRLRTRTGATVEFTFSARYAPHDALIFAAAERTHPATIGAPLEGLSTLAVVAAGIAHEVNNPLAYVLTNLDFVREQLGSECDAEIGAALEEAKLGALRIGAIVRNLQIVVTDEARLIEIDIAEIVEAACLIVQSEITIGAKIVTTRTWAPRVTGNESRVTYTILKMLMFAARGSARSERSALRVATGTDENGDATFEIEGVSEMLDVASTERAMTSNGLRSLASTISARLTAQYRNGAVVLRLSFPRTVAR